MGSLKLKERFFLVGGGFLAQLVLPLTLFVWVKTSLCAFWHLFPSSNGFPDPNSQISRSFLFEALPLREEDGGGGESTIILISPRLAGLYTPLMMDKILHSLRARNTQRLPNEPAIGGERLISRSEFYSMSDLSKTPVLFTPPEVRDPNIAQYNKSTLFCLVI